jgi:zinc transport system ATP-binding protein
VDRSLIVTYQDKEFFSSRAKWLFPLFDLEEFLAGKKFPVEEMELTERVAGQAAAFLISRLGFRKCHVKLISEHAVAVFERFDVVFTYDEKVPQIQCRTEHILMREMDLEEAWQLLRRRAGRVHGADISIEKLEVNIRRRCILNGLDLELKRGDGMIICGENGVGKTTLLRAILGLQKINSGLIKIADVQVGSLVWRKNRHIAGYVNQERTRNIFPVSAAEVVEIGLAGRRLSREIIRERVKAAMRRTGCINLADQPFHKLSGGEKQRVSLARCICQQARVLLFDEPTTFLDPKGREDLFNMLIELWEKEAPTILIVSHDNSWIERFKWEVKEMKEGKIW